MSSLRVMVVDDEPSMRSAMARAIQKLRLESPVLQNPAKVSVEQCPSGQEALAAIAAQMPDILLLDYKLPDMTGREVLAQAAGQCKGMLTILLTGCALPEAAQLVQERVAWDLLTKPFTPKELLAAIHRACQCVLLQRLARQRAQENRAQREAFVEFLARELDITLDALQHSIAVLRTETVAHNTKTMSTVLDVATERLNRTRQQIAGWCNLTSPGQPQDLGA